MITLSELPAPNAPNALKPSDARWLLVDHNVLTGPLARTYSSSEITGCVDHHGDEGKVPRDADPRVIEKCGSCMSLVVEHSRAIWDSLEEDEKESIGDGTNNNDNDNDNDNDDNDLQYHLARLALAPVLIDTRNLGDATKTTARDERAVEYAEAKLSSAGGGSDDKTYDRTTLFERLSRLKSDIEPLSLRDILRKDYKEWDEGEGGGDESKRKDGAKASAPQVLKLGTSSVPRSISFLVQKAGSEGKLVDALASWGEERGVDLVVVMSSFSPAEEVDSSSSGSEDHARELLVWARTGEQAADAARRFADANAEMLELRTWGDGKLDVVGQDGQDGREWRRCWTQGKMECSRKQVAPMLREAMKRSLYD